MNSRALPFGTLMATALTTGLTFSHLMEMPGKRRFDAPNYLRTQQIYRTFGPIGGVMEPGAVVAAASYAFASRNRTSAFYPAVIGTGLLASALATWLALVAPMNARFDRWTRESVPTDWQSARDQWEYAHAARALLQIAGLGALTYAALSDRQSPGLVARALGHVRS